MLEFMGNVLLCPLVEKEGKRICEISRRYFDFAVFYLKHEVEKDSCLPYTTLLAFLLTFYYHKTVHETGES